jgi:hypothetical protein
MKVNIKHTYNDIDRVTSKYSEKRLWQSNFVHQRSQWTGLGLQLGLHTERLATNHLRHGATYVFFPHRNIWWLQFFKYHNTILCFKMYITAEWQNRDGHRFFKQYTFYVLLATTRETWDWRILCVCVCVCVCACTCMCVCVCLKRTQIMLMNWCFFIKCI